MRKKITEDVVFKLLGMLKMGLEGFAGYGPTQFCVQQAVSKVITNDKKNNSDTPNWCVNNTVIQFGINLNDQVWLSKKARGEGLKRFAVAELGSKSINGDKFLYKLAEKTKMTKIDMPQYANVEDIISYFIAYNTGSLQKKLTQLANLAADVLTEMGTEGSKFLYLLDEPDKTKANKEAKALGKKIFASQMAEIDYYCGTTVKA